MAVCASSLRESNRAATRASGRLVWASCWGALFGCALLFGCSLDETQLWKRNYFFIRQEATLWLHGADNKTFNRKTLVSWNDGSPEQRTVIQEQERYGAERSSGWPPVGGIEFADEHWLMVDGDWPAFEDGYTMGASFRLEEPPNDVVEGTIFALGTDQEAYGLSVRESRLITTIAGHEYELGVELREEEPILLTVQVSSDGFVTVRLNRQQILRTEVLEPELTSQMAEGFRVARGMNWTLGWLALFDYQLPEQELDELETNIATQLYCCKE